jgi:hypothetical protein
MARMFDRWRLIELFACVGMIMIFARWQTPLTPQSWRIRAILGGLLMATNLPSVSLEFPMTSLALWAMGCLLVGTAARDQRLVD